jgi:lon-related putative ATP-dependent protease
VYEDHPTLQNLIGRLEHLSVQGTLITHLGLIKAGALHKANGGYLMIDAIRLLGEPFAYDALKRALRGRELRLESAQESLGLITTQTLEPEAVPLAVRVVLIGDQRLHALLSALDPDFGDLFKVPAEFGADLEWTPEVEPLFARKLASIVRRHQLLPLDRTAVGRVMEHAARRAGSKNKLSVELRDLADLLREADHLARAAGKRATAAGEVDQAIAARIRRADRPRERLHDAIARGALLIDTDGAKVGQVNAISVVDLGAVSFGQPVRITARSRLGDGGVLDIEREVELGGPIHSKGVLILQGFLGGRYAQDLPPALSASLVFEQSYGGVEGDSASCAELCALLSSLAEAPIAQSLAVTGSVNQHGQVQPIGGVNEKVEGFFDVCRRRGGLTGKQGVLIPKANLENLLLRADVVSAVKEGRFAVYPVETVDQAIALLTQRPAAEVHRRVEERLRLFAETARSARRDQAG